MSQRKARRMDVLSQTVAVGIFVYAAVMGVFEGLIGRWELALLFLVVAVVNLQSLRMLRNSIKLRRESQARIAQLDAYIAAYEQKRDDA